MSIDVMYCYKADANFELDILGIMKPFNFPP